MRTAALIWTTRVVLGDLLRESLGRCPEIRRVEFVQSAREFMREARRGAWDVAVIDPWNPVEDVFRSARTVAAGKSSLRLIFLAASSAMGWVCQAVQVGAFGYLGKCASLGDIRGAIREALCGQRTFSPCVGRLVYELARSGEGCCVLTDRQKEVLDRICKGATSKEIAGDLGISSKSVEAVRACLMKKSGTSNGFQLVRWACTERFVEMHPQHEPGPNAAHAALDKARGRSYHPA